MEDFQDMGRGCVNSEGTAIEHINYLLLKSYFSLICQGLFGKVFTIEDTFKLTGDWTDGEKQTVK